MDRTDDLAPPTIGELAAAMTRLLRKTGTFQPAPPPDALPPEEQAEWTLWSTTTPRDPAGFRATFRYRRPDVCGLEVYDLGDVRGASWRRPMGRPLADLSGRDAGIWEGGRTMLDAVLAGLLPPPLPETRVEEFVRLNVRQAKLDDPDSPEFISTVMRMNRLWAAMSDDEKKRARA